MKPFGSPLPPLRRSLWTLLLLFLALSFGSCRQAIRRSAEKIRIDSVERIVPRGLTGIEATLHVTNGSAHRLRLDAARFDLYRRESRLGSIRLVQPVALEKHTAESLMTRWKIEVEDPLLLLAAAADLRSGRWDDLYVSCRIEGKGGPAPVNIFRERVPLSDFLTTFGLTKQDLVQLF